MDTGPAGAQREAGPRDVAQPATGQRETAKCQPEHGDAGQREPEQREAGQREPGQLGVPQPAGTCPEAVRFDGRGLVPVVVQDRTGGEVLMLAYANREALARTLAEGRAWFYSRSRQRLWRKGETSGNELAVREVRVDCDGDAVLYLVDPAGPACHTGERTCFHRDVAGRKLPAGARPAASSAPSDSEATPPAFLARLEALIRSRRRERPAGSYTTALFEAGLPRILQKVGEEAVETVVAGGHQEPARLVEEAADLIYHLTVLLVERGLGWNDVMAELGRRDREA